MTRHAFSVSTLSIVVLALLTPVRAGAGPECGAFTLPSRAPAPSDDDSPFTPRGATCPGCTVEVHVVLDRALLDRFGAFASPVVNLMVSDANQITSPPQSVGGLDLRLVRSGETAFNTGDPWPAETDPVGLLFDLKNWADINLPVPATGRSLVILITGLELDGSGHGALFQSTICTSNAFGLLSVTSNQRDVNATRLAHQIAHILGAVHDVSASTCSAGFVMGDEIFLLDPQTTFSSCSIGRINNRLATSGGCLLPGRCSDADLAFPFGFLDFSDVVEYLNAFSASDPFADLAAPFGAFDFNDLIAFLQLFSAGCP